LAALAGLLALFNPTWAWATDGHILHGIGPVNQSMGGASTAVCLDPLGSVAWNPACTGALQGKLMDFSLEIFVPTRTLSSTVPENGFGPGFPPATLSGSTKSATNTAFLPNFAYVNAEEGRRTVFHFAFMGTAGFGVDYAGNTDLSNPITSPQPPDGLGYGAIESNYALMKMPVGFSRRIGERLTLGVSAVPAFSMLKVTPAPFSAPVMDPDTGFPYYVSADKSAKALGVGFTTGARYQANSRLSLGIAYHSPIWFQSFKWDTTDRAGEALKLDFTLNVPAMVTMGIGVHLTSSTLLAVDGRWLDYENTEGFRGSGFNPDGSVRGFGWRNIWMIGSGLQQVINDKLTVRFGYNWSQNPVPDGLSFFNTPAPAIIRHRAGGGLTYRFSPGWALNATYYHAFENQGSGPYINPAMGAIPGTMVMNEMHEDSVSFGFTRFF